MIEDRRSHERVATNLAAKWHGLAGEREGRVEDLSLAGCFVNTTGRVDLGETVGVELKLPSGNWLPLRGKVTSYQLGTGFGMAFISLTDDEKQSLIDLVE